MSNRVMAVNKHELILIFKLEKLPRIDDRPTTLPSSSLIVTVTLNLDNSSTG